MTETKKTVSLVLGSGGARGLAHIGVIHWLEEHNYQIKSISGCSMGSVIGGVYAAGQLQVFEDWVKNITKANMVSLLDLSWGKGGLVRGDKIINTLKNLIGDKTIEQLPIPFTAVAADVKLEKEVWINSGNLFDAIRASISLPLFFTPFNYKGTQLIDGGVLNPVPIAPTFSDETDLTIAVNLGGNMQATPLSVKGKALRTENKSTSNSSIAKFIDKIRSPKTEKTSSDWGVYDVANQAFDAMQSTIARQKLAAYPPDVAIDIARNACGTFDFDLASEIIQHGYEKAEQALGKLSNK